MSLTWENASFIPARNVLNTFQACFGDRLENSPIFTNLNGSIKLGELTALMGPSGSGKSTLLKGLAAGNNYNGFSCKIFTTGISRVRASFITQDEKDHLLLNLTVEESLRYASEMKNPLSTPKAKHQEIVDEVISDLNLTECRGKRVKKCSGGQQKRLAIGLELTSVEKPNFLFLDEPTSGLDSYTGFVVVKLLAHLAQTHNMAIVISIHQPSFEIFSKFDQAYIISGTGNCIFKGNSADLREYLRAYRYNGLADENPAESIIKIGCSVNRNRESALNVNRAAERCSNLSTNEGTPLTSIVSVPCSARSR